LSDVAEPDAEGSPAKADGCKHEIKFTSEDLERHQRPRGHIRLHEDKTCRQYESEDEYHDVLRFATLCYGAVPCNINAD
jgi:hypothetical protein